MKTQKTNLKKLVLRTDTIRSLDEANLNQVAGGSGSCWCSSGKTPHTGIVVGI